MRKICLGVAVLMAGAFYAAAEGGDSIPRLDELAGQTQFCATLEIMPALCNFHGGVAAGRNVASIEALTLPPFSQGGEALRLTVNGRDVPAAWSRWLPHEIQRGANVDGLLVDTRVRMVFESAGVLFRIQLSNDTEETRNVALGITDPLLIRRFDRTWEWGTPRPDVTKNDFSTEATSNNLLCTTDSQSAVVAALAFGTPPNQLKQGENPRAEWSVTLQPHETFALTLALAVDKDRDAASARASEWMKGFDACFQSARDLWQQRFDAAFTPGNGHFSGALPTLKTDDPTLRRIYYTSILGWLALERTNFPGAYPRVFVTVSPHYAPTLTYFWDTISYGTLWTLLDPEQVKAQLRLFLKTDIHTCYAVDFLTGKGVGPWYSANDYSVFHLLWTYLRLTHDQAFLDESISDKTVLALMESLALHWKTLVKQPDGLADYGTKDNLLETVPTYTNQIPSFNASNVWMMRRMADIFSARGNATRAKQLQDEAALLAGKVLGLHDASTGWWYCRMPDGAMKEVRSVVDFLTVGTCMHEDLSPAMRARMMDAADKELWSGAWLRALSLEDPSATAAMASPEKMATLNSPWPGDSLRADHGFTGSYDAWPALALETFCLLGRPERAREMLRAVEPVLDEGPFGQSHYVATPEHSVRKAFKGGQDYYEGCGGAFAEVMLRCLLDKGSIAEEGSCVLEYLPVPTPAVNHSE